MLLYVNNLEVCYGVISALQDVSLHIDQGEVVTLIGSNGAGKTTLLRTISGLIRPARGTIEWSPGSAERRAMSDEENCDEAKKGRSDEGKRLATGNSQTATNSSLIAHRSALTSLRPDQIVHLGISHVPEGRQVFPDMTVRENLLLGAYQRHNHAQIAADLARSFTHFPILGERRKQKAGTLSGGEQQMLAIARALMSRPKLLLLDEPSLGLAPLIVRKIFQIIQEINTQGTTIFLVEQNAHLALTIAHRAYVLQSGRVIKTDVASNLLEDPDVKKAYLGG